MIGDWRKFKQHVHSIKEKAVPGNESQTQHYLYISAIEC